MPDGKIITLEKILKPCPCGETPKELHITNDSDYEFAVVSGDCCQEWHVMFDSHKFGYGYNAEYKAAVEAWNESPRK